MSSGDKSQRMELLITKSGPRTIDPAGPGTQVHFFLERPSVLIVVLVILKIVGATETMLASF